MGFFPWWTNVDSAIEYFDSKRTKNTFSTQDVAYLNLLDIKKRGRSFDVKALLESALAVSLRPYAENYFIFQKMGYDLTGYPVPSIPFVEPVKPVEPALQSNGKKTNFSGSGEVGVLLRTVQPYNRYMPQDFVRVLETFNILDYRTTYLRLAGLGIDMSGYVHPDLLRVANTTPTAQNQVVSYAFGGFLFLLVFGALVLWILRYFFRS